MVIRRTFPVLLAIVWLALAGPTIAQNEYPIGTIQGPGDVSPFKGRVVAFRGVVTAVHEDQNSRGIIYYTAYVQDSPGAEDGDPATSDAIPVFLGRNQPAFGIGAQIRVAGRVTEFYGLTEIDDDGLWLVVEEEEAPLPEATPLNPPAEVEELAEQLEPLEGMRVEFPGSVIISGATHAGCGFAVLAGDPVDNRLPVARRSPGDPVGRIVPVLYPSDVDCRDLPALKSGDRVTGISGPLIYNFDQFKVLLEDPSALEVSASEAEVITPLPELLPGQISVVTLNANDYFDTVDDTGTAAEPVLTPAELEQKQSGLANGLSGWLGCPTVAGIQEVEHAHLLDALAAELTTLCGFTYEVSHRESIDGRGIDNALLSDPRHVTVLDAHLRQVCSPVPTGLQDASINCQKGDEPLFGRPPLQVDVLIDGRLHTIFVNHFKSKRGGAAETALRRLAQARYQNALAADLLAADPEARLIIMGDFNDTDQSPVMQTMTHPAEGGVLANALLSTAEDERYSYVFGGVAELIDTILISPALEDELQTTGVLHANTDYPYQWAFDENTDLRFSDHDVPWALLFDPPAATPTPSPEPLPEPTKTTKPPTVTPTLQPSAPPPATPTMTPAPTNISSTPLVVAPPLPETPTVWPWLVSGLVAAAGGMFLVLRGRRP